MMAILTFDIPRQVNRLLGKPMSYPTNLSSCRVAQTSNRCCLLIYPVTSKFQSQSLSWSLISRCPPYSLSILKARDIRGPRWIGIWNDILPVMEEQSHHFLKVQCPSDSRNHILDEPFASYQVCLFVFSAWTTVYDCLTHQVLRHKTRIWFAPALDWLESSCVNLSKLRKWKVQINK